MIDENSECIKELLSTHINKIEASLLAAHPDSDLQEQLKTRTHYEGNGKVKACLSFHPQLATTKERIELMLMLSCTQRGAVFASELAWSDGKTIEQVVVCEVCPDCLEDLCGCVDSLVDRIQELLVERMI
jgi:hypothetical protein